jgi:hypothetical protein
MKRTYLFLAVSVMAALLFAGCVSMAGSNSAEVVETSYNPDFYQDVETPFEGTWDGTWYAFRGGQSPCRFIFKGNTFVWYLKGKVFTRGAFEIDDTKLILEIKDILSTNAQLPGIYGVIVWSKQNNLTGMKVNFDFTFADSSTLSLKAGEEHAELKRNE